MLVVVLTALLSLLASLLGAPFRGVAVVRGHQAGEPVSKNTGVSDFCLCLIARS